MSIYSPQYKRLANEIKRVRQNTNLNQQDFAKKLDVSQSYISKLENGQIKIDVLLMKKIAKILNLDINKLLVDIEG